MVDDGYVDYVDFSGFDPRITQELMKAVVNAKTDFPKLNIRYLGSIKAQVQGLYNTFANHQYAVYKKAGYTDEQANQLAKWMADKYIKDSKLNNTGNTYAWSLQTNNPALAMFDGVAINDVYKDNYELFTSKKRANEACGWSPIGCGTIKACFDHEMGHEIDKILDASLDSEINRMYSEFCSQGNYRNSLSDYATKDVKEFIAEAYSEYCNNPNPRQTARDVYNRLNFLRDQKQKTLVKRR